MNADFNFNLNEWIWRLTFPKVPLPKTLSISKSSSFLFTLVWQPKLSSSRLFSWSTLLWVVSLRASVVSLITCGIEKLALQAEKTIEFYSKTKIMVGLSSILQLLHWPLCCNKRENAGNPHLSTFDRLMNSQSRMT